MQGYQFKMVMQIYMGQATNMALLKLLGAGKRFTTPNFFRDVPEFNDIDFSCPNYATKLLFQIIDFDDIARLITPFTILAIRFILIKNGVSCYCFSAIHYALRKAVIVLIRTPKRQSFSSVHLPSW